MGHPQPGVWNRLVAANRGEVSAELLEAYRRAGATLHEQLDAIEKIRFDRKLAGRSPWDAPLGEQTELVCTWNAYALQTLGDAFLEADYEAHPVTAGFVPRVTYNQVMDLYSGVEGWLGKARQAGANSKYRPDVMLPAPLPHWSEVEPCPRPHLDGMMKAVERLRLHFEHALHIFEGEGTPERYREQLEYIRGVFAEARSKADYIGAMYQPGASPELHERIEEQAKIVVELLYRAGQLVAMPALVDVERSRALPVAPSIRPAPPVQTTTYRLPGEPGFDAWKMTDEDAYRSNGRDQGAVRAIQDMWKYDPDPSRSLRLWADIDMAVKRGDAEVARNTRTGNKIGNFACTPYASIWRALKPLNIGGTRINTMQTFTLEVACEGVLVGRAFKRNVIVGDFQPAELEYCDPNIPEDDH